MTNQIKTVTNREQFDIIITNFFVKGELFIKTSSADLAVQFLGYSDGQMALRIPGIKNLPSSVVCFTMQKGYTVYCSLDYEEKTEDTYIFTPVKFQIISVERKEDRTMIDMSGGSTNVIFVSKISSDFFLRHALEINDKKNEKVKEIAVFELEKSGFDKIKIVFNYEARNDVRMKHVQTQMTPLFIPDLNKNADPKYEEQYNYYINTIWSRDNQIPGGGKYIAEALVPIIHRNAIPYGYIQVNHSKPLSDGHLVVIQRIAIVIDQLFIKQKQLVPLPQKFLVSDVSEGGFGIVFKDRSLARNFRKDSLFVCEMMLPTSKKVIFSAITRNILFLENNLVKVGNQITRIDDVSRGNLQEYLEKMDK